MALAKLIDLAPRITFLAGDVNYTFIHFVDAPKLLICKTLKECSDELQGFIRIHKKYTINPAYLERVIITDQDKASVLIGGQWIPISRRRNKEVLLQLWQIQKTLWLVESSALEEGEDRESQD